MTANNITETQMANAIRFLAMDAVQAANSGHPGLPMGAADVATVLFNRFIKIDPSNPKWADRDRFVLSAGHGSMLIYAIHHLLGYKDMPIEEIKNFRQWGSKTAGHPEYGHADGIETTTGPLGQGITNAVGMALAERMMNARYGDDLVKHFTYVIAGDGCLMEGVSHEAIDMAGHLKLGSMIVMWDDNRITIDGDTDVATSTSQQARFEASGWHVQSVDGHNHDEIAAAIEAAQKDPRPSMIACRTIIGYGAPNKQGGHNVHGAPIGVDEIAAARAHLNWEHEAFVIPSDIKSSWEAIARRGKESRAEWESRLNASDQKSAFEAQLKGVDQKAVSKALSDYRTQLVADAPKVASRKASQMVLEIVNNVTDLTIGGSADLTGSNLTASSQTKPIQSDSYNERYVHYGVREHAMAAVMNGMFVHGGFRPYGGTFLVFADYMRGAMRLSALMELGVIYVLSHDSIGQGEDGPTHQPVETLASLRAIPNMRVIRPCDAVETAEAWELALASEKTPTVLALSRQNLACLRKDGAMRSDKGAYVLRDVEKRDITLVATGSEVELAMNAAEELAKDGVSAAVVSAPCFEIFAEQTEEYRSEVLGQAPRIGIEAAIQQGWDLMLRHKDQFIGMTGFGASAPGGRVFQEFGFTVENVVKKAKSAL